jgi:hypothetical protein
MSDVILHVHYKSASQPSNNVQDLLKFVSNWWKKKIEKKIKTKFTFNTPWCSITSDMLFYHVNHDFMIVLL